MPKPSHGALLDPIAGMGTPGEPTAVGQGGLHAPARAWGAQGQECQRAPHGNPSPSMLGTSSPHQPHHGVQGVRPKSELRWGAKAGEAQPVAAAAELGAQISEQPRVN